MLLRLPDAPQAQPPFNMDSQRLTPRSLVVSLLLVWIWTFPAFSPAAAEDLDFAVSFGLFDIGQSEKATEAGVEARFESRRIFKLDLVPIVGFSANEDGAFWGYAGFRWEVPLGEKWQLAPTFGAALYEEGDSKDLGHTLEFRSGIEIARRFPKGRLGLLLYHLSNASISDHNPGEESLLLTWTFGP